jgi:hypothetical protein
MKIELQTNQYLIQEFMGVDKTKRFVPYHSCWNWLMPVVHNCTKIIENYGYDSDARNYFEDEIFNLDNTLSEFLNNDIESVYARVVEFIKYYNETK